MIYQEVTNTMSAAAAVTEATFEQEVLKSDVPVVVDFWAEWCGPCKQIGPVLDELVSQYAGKAKILKVNVDQERQLAIRYDVQSIPNLIFFKNGEKKDQLIGVAGSPKDNISRKLDALL